MQADYSADRFSYATNEAAIQDAERFDGKLALLTNVTDFSAEQIVSRYKSRPCKIDQRPTVAASRGGPKHQDRRAPSITVRRTPESPAPMPPIALYNRRQSGRKKIGAMSRRTIARSSQRRL